MPAAPRSQRLTISPKPSELLTKSQKYISGFWIINRGDYNQGNSRYECHNHNVLGSLILQVRREAADENYDQRNTVWVVRLELPK